MQDLSYNFRNRIFHFNQLQFEVQVFTFENVYGLDAERCQETRQADALAVECSRLSWAGGQERENGFVRLRAEARQGATIFSLEAGCEKAIRCVKLLLTGLPKGEVVNLREGPAPVTETGLILEYPSGWRSLFTPLVVLKTAEDRYWYFRSLDDQVRARRFALIERNGRVDVELIFEELATRVQPTLSVPAWEVGACPDPLDAYRRHARHLEAAYRLQDWETRPDIPAWARRIALLASIHCRHFTGYVFNDYAQVLKAIQWLSERFDPTRILVYLPGWEGRYYWRYGEYRPDPRLGGEAGLHALADGARKLGAHLMPMFGINIVNQGLENYERWGRPAVISSPGGISGMPTVDWDSSRHFDHGWCALLNPGAPTWQNHLVHQIERILDEYGFDAVYLDISAGWFNDPKYEVYPGTCEVIRRLRRGRPHLLVTGEGWYDAVSAALAVHQGGHSEGKFHWHDEPWEGFFSKYNRSYGHLCLGDAGRGSTGVHELGYNKVYRVPLRKGLFPTMTIVEDTIQRAPEKLLEILGDAEAYIEAYLKDEPHSIDSG